MKISVRVRGQKKASKFIQWAREKIAENFSRISDQVRSIEAFFSDLNGPKGGRDQNLLLAVRLLDGRIVTVRTIDESMGRVLDHGVDRSFQAVLRQLQRARANRRRWHHLPQLNEPDPT